MERCSSRVYASDDGSRAKRQTDPEVSDSGTREDTTKISQIRRMLQNWTDKELAMDDL